MKKLLFVAFSLGKPGGVQTVLTNLMNELCNEYDITVLCLDGFENFVYELDPRIKSVVLNSFDTRSFTTMVFLDKYFRKLPKRQNIKNYIYQYGVYCLLKKWLKKNHQDYDYVITTRYMLASMVSIMRGINKKTYAWEHNNYNIGGFFWFTLMRPYYKNLKGVIYLNNESGEYYEKYNSNTHLIRNIVGKPFETTTHINIDEKENIVLFVGRLSSEKNVEELANIFDDLDNPKQWKLYFIGDGPDKNLLDNFITQNNISNILLLGKMKKEEVYQYMRKSKILVLTSETECLPTVLLEAMFCSNALVSYNCKYGPANIINENNGFLVEIHNKKTFTEKLQLLIDNENLLERLNKSSYQESKKWKKEIVLGQWRKLFQ